VTLGAELEALCDLPAASIAETLAAEFLGVALAEALCTGGTGALLVSFF